ncbi:MAG: hypothetical protein KGS61_10150 [Verrucomicrobia bacterium]|nr:hypothetical protein [Verrucomicrobiota bacterium]
MVFLEQQKPRVQVERLAVALLQILAQADLRLGFLALAHRPHPRFDHDGQIRHDAPVTVHQFIDHAHHGVV